MEDRRIVHLDHRYERSGANIVRRDDDIIRIFVDPSNTEELAVLYPEDKGISKALRDFVGRRPYVIKVGVNDEKAFLKEIPGFCKRYWFEYRLYDAD